MPDVDLVPGRRTRYMVLAVGALALLVVLVRNAWVTDDAFITFRTLDNFVHGRGLRWNVAERVQSFTNPLWLFLLAPLYALTGEAFYTSSAVSVVLTLTTAAVLAGWVARTHAAAGLAFVLLAGSKACVDFSVSGMENPLSNVLLAAFAATLVARGAEGPRLAWLSALAAAAALTRLDNILLLIPALAWAIGRSWGRAVWWPLLAGVVPIAAWEGFSLLYYGFPFPNTAYAKLGVEDMTRWELITQGGWYLWESARLDPLTPAVIACAMAAAAWARAPQQVALASGMFLHLLYVVAIGGDFMSGRFLAASYLCAVALLTDLGLSMAGGGWVVPASLAIVAALPARSPLRSGADYGSAPGEQEIVRGISDERAQYFDQSGLLAVPWGQGPQHAWVDLGKSFARESAVHVHKTVGYLGYYAGPRAHIVDRMALCDALLAHIPRRSQTERDTSPAFRRIGHLMRDVPPGYVQTLETGRNAIQDPHLAEYYDHLALVIRGPIFSRERLGEIWRLNTGAYDGLMQAYVRAEPSASARSGSPE